MLTSPAAALALLLAAATPADWSQAQAVSLAATDYAFEPSRLTLRVGVPYRLHVDNRGAELHEFTAPDFLKSVDLRNPEVLNADRTELVIHPGEQKDLFLVPRQSGRYPFVCADHDWAGMTGEVVVE